jgi:hypothetical protein
MFVPRLSLACKHILRFDVSENDSYYNHATLMDGFSPVAFYKIIIMIVQSFITIFDTRSLLEFTINHDKDRYPVQVTIGYRSSWGSVINPY